MAYGGLGQTRVLVFVVIAESGLGTEDFRAAQFTWRLDAERVMELFRLCLCKACIFSIAPNLTYRYSAECVSQIT